MSGADEMIFRQVTYLPLAVLLSLIGNPCVASALVTPKGCDLPSEPAAGSKFFIDPVNGSMANDGSATHPWRTLVEVVDPANHLIATRAYTRRPEGGFDLKPINPAGVVKPGDTLVLRAGDHGAVNISQYVNDKFISVVAAENQTPVIRSMTIFASSHWLFRGLKFQPAQPERKTGVAVRGNDSIGYSDNIIFVQNSFSTQDTTDDWSDVDWVNKPWSPGFDTSARCTTLLGNHFFNLRDAMGITGQNSLVEDNLFEAFGNDAIDMDTSDLVIRGNTIRDGRHTSADSGHPDAIQGWTSHGAVNRNITIDGNLIVNMSKAEGNALQGISIFDGEWENVTVTNNAVVTNLWNGIALYGINHLKLINNTVVAARPNIQTWISVKNAKDNRRSTDIVVRNNIATVIGVDGDGGLIDHNIAQSRITLNVTNSVASSNRTITNIFKQFVSFDPDAGGVPDLRPKLTSPAIGEGNPDLAPPSDISGRARTPPVDIGAYAR